MFYEINVSLNGHHYFATAERSLTSKEAAIKLAHQFKIAFPETGCYEVTLYSWTKTGKQIHI